MSDQGWQPRLCANCGHTAGEHRRASRTLRASGRGVCMNSACECREFIEPGERQGGDRAA